MAPLGKSHHQILKFKFNEALITAESKCNYLYHKTYFIKLREDLKDIDWGVFFKSNDVEQMWNSFHETFQNLVNKFTHKTKTNIKKRKPLWLNKSAISKVKKKNHAYHRYLQTREGQDYLEYAKARNQAKAACRRAIRDYHLYHL